MPAGLDGDHHQSQPSARTWARAEALCARHLEPLQAREAGTDVEAELRAVGEEMAALAASVPYEGPFGEWIAE